MPLFFSKHATKRLAELYISKGDVENVVKCIERPAEEVINGRMHNRYFANEITVITNLRADTVATVWKGERGNW